MPSLYFLRRLCSFSTLGRLSFSIALISLTLHASPPNFICTFSPNFNSLGFWWSFKGSELGCFSNLSRPAIEKMAQVGVRNDKMEKPVEGWHLDVLTMLRLKRDRWGGRYLEIWIRRIQDTEWEPYHECGYCRPSSPTNNTKPPETHRGAEGHSCCWNCPTPLVPTTLSDMLGFFEEVFGQCQGPDQRGESS